jgi:hypothetical protein
VIYGHQIHIEVHLGHPVTVYARICWQVTGPTCQVPAVFHFCKRNLNLVFFLVRAPSSIPYEKKRIPPWTDPTRDSHPSLPQLAEPFSPSPAAVGVAPPSPASSSTRTETNAAVIIDSHKPRRPWGTGDRARPMEAEAEDRERGWDLGHEVPREIENAGAGISSRVCHGHRGVDLPREVRGRRKETTTSLDLPRRCSKRGGGEAAAYGEEKEHGETNSLSAEGAGAGRGCSGVCRRSRYFSGTPRCCVDGVLSFCKFYSLVLLFFIIWK